MIELVFSVCFLSAPYNCRETKNVYQDVSVKQCTMLAQIELAKWVGDHPGWRITRYVCQPAGMFAKL